MHQAQLPGDAERGGEMSGDTEAELQVLNEKASSALALGLSEKLSDMTKERDALKAELAEYRRTEPLKREELASLRAELAKVREISGDAMQNYETAVTDLHRAKAELAELRAESLAKSRLCKRVLDSIYDYGLSEDFPIKLLIELRRELPKAPEVKT